MNAPHLPVLLDEVVAALAIAPGDVVVDGTFGAGGYTAAILDAGAEVIAFDRDPDAIAEAAASVGYDVSPVRPAMDMFAARAAE